MKTLDARMWRTRHNIASSRAVRMDPSSKEPIGSADEENLAETRRFLAELNSMARELESERRRDRLSLSRRRQTRLNDGLQTSMNVAPMDPPPMPPTSLLQISPAPELLPPPMPPLVPQINRRMRLSLRGQEI